MKLLTKKTTIALACAAVALATPSTSFAIRVCLKATANKTTGKVTFTKTTSSGSCPSGSTEIIDSDKLPPPSIIPSGTTVRGVTGGSGPSGTLTFVPISLPMPAPQPLTDENIIVANVTDLSDLLGGCTTTGCLSSAEAVKNRASCTGTFDNPTAAAGKLCIYVDVNFGGYDLEGQLLAKSTNPNGGSKSGVGFQWYTDVGVNSKVKASWAYRAP